MTKHTAATLRALFQSCGLDKPEVSHPIRHGEFGYIRVYVVTGYFAGRYVCERGMTAGEVMERVAARKAQIVDAVIDELLPSGLGGYLPDTHGSAGSTLDSELAELADAAGCEGEMDREFDEGVAG